MTRPVIVLGAGGHAKVLIDALQVLSVNIIGATDPDPKKIGTSILNIPVIGTDEAVMEYSQEEILLVNGLGSIRQPGVRTQLFAHFKKRGYSFASVIHPAATLAAGAKLGEGVQIMAGAIVQTGCRIGDNSILNTGAAVDHDCIIGDHVHLAPRVTLSGGVEIGAGVHVGTGAIIIQGIKIGSHTLIGAGALVVRSVPENVTAMGVPAREV